MIMIDDAPPPDDPKKRAVARAGILAKDERFQVWARVFDEEGAAAFIRDRCGVGSRRDIAQRPEALKKFVELDTEFLLSSNHLGDEGLTLALKVESQEGVADQNTAPPRGAVIAEIVPEKLKDGGMDWGGYAERVLAEYRRLAPGNRNAFRRMNAPHMTLLRSADRDASTELQVEMGRVDEASRQQEPANGR